MVFIFPVGFEENLSLLDFFSRDLNQMEDYVQAKCFWPVFFRLGRWIVWQPAVQADEMWSICLATKGSLLLALVCVGPPVISALLPFFGEGFPY